MANALLTPFMWTAGSLYGANQLLPNNQEYSSAVTVYQPLGPPVQSFSGRSVYLAARRGYLGAVQALGGPLAAGTAQFALELKESGAAESAYHWLTSPSSTPVQQLEAGAYPYQDPPIRTNVSKGLYRSITKASYKWHSPRSASTRHRASAKRRRGSRK